MLFRKSEDELKERAEHTKPLVRVSSRTDPVGILYWAEPTSIDSPRSVRILAPARPAEDIETLAEIVTHYPLSEGFFKPTLKEVLEQIDGQWLPSAVGFEVTGSAREVTIETEKEKKRYWEAKTILYQLKQ